MYPMMIVASGILTAVTPFAIVSDTVDAAIIAGIFSVVNTILNARIIHELRQHRDEVRPIAVVAEKVQHRRGDLISEPELPDARLDDSTEGDG